MTSSLHSLWQSLSRSNSESSQQPIDVLDPLAIPTWETMFEIIREKPEYGKLMVSKLNTYPVDSQLSQIIKLYYGDISKLKADVVVNAANTNLSAGGGVCGVLHSVAGPSLNVECEEWVEQHGQCPTGSTAATSGYHLPCKYVFHTVGPTDGDGALLSSCYRSCLDLLLKMQARSIAFCCVSTGIYGFPNEEASIIACKTVREWLMEKEEHRLAVDCIVFCCFLMKDYVIYQKTLPSCFPLQLPKPQEQAAQKQEDANARDQAELHPISAAAMSIVPKDSINQSSNETSEKSEKEPMSHDT